MNTLDTPLRVTFFSSYAADTKREEAYTPRTLAERIRVVTAAKKSQLPWLKLARFGDLRSDKKSLRHDANVLAITGIEGDYDGGRMEFDDACERLDKQGVASIVYTSPSHTEDAPRWRVLCPLSQEMPPDSRRQHIGRLNGLLGGIFSRESFTLSQSYYFGSVSHNPSHRVKLIDGEAIDLHDDLDAIWTGPSNKSATAGTEQPTSTGDERGIADLVQRIVTGAEYHTALCPLAARMIGRNVPPGTVAELLRGLMLARPVEAQDARWKSRFAEISRFVESATGKYGEAAARRKASNRAVAAIASRMIRARRPSAEIRDAVLAEAAKRDVPPDRAQAILKWIAERELAARRNLHVHQ